MPDFPVPEPEGDLLRRLAEGDEEAFIALYRRWQAPIHRFALRMSGRLEIAEDVTQEVFLALARAAGRYDPGRGPLSAYLYGIARNQVRKRLERERPLQPLADDEAGPDRPGAEGPEEDLRRVESSRAVWRALRGLPAHYREAVVLCELEGLGYAEAAAALGCAVGTVRSRLHRGRALLAERLRPRLRPGPALTEETA